MKESALSDTPFKTATFTACFYKVEQRLAGLQIVRGKVGILYTVQLAKAQSQRIGKGKIMQEHILYQAHCALRGISGMFYTYILYMHNGKSECREVLLHSGCIIRRSIRCKHVQRQRQGPTLIKKTQCFVIRARAKQTIQRRIFSNVLCGWKILQFLTNQGKITCMYSY